MSRPVTVAVLGLATALTADAWAQIPLTPEFQVNTYTTNSQYRPAIAADAAGNFVVVWESPQDGNGTGIFARKYQADGTPLGSSEFRVNVYTTGNQFRSAVAADPNGGLVVAWDSYGQDGSDVGVFARRYDSGGTPGPEFQVNTYTTNAQSYKSVAVDGAGNFVVAWESYQDGSARAIVARRYNASGAAQGSEFQVNAYTTNDQIGPSVAMDATGNFVIAWYGAGSGDNDGVFARRYDAAGVPQSGDFRVNTYTTGTQGVPSAAMAPDGTFVVAWMSAVQDGSGFGVFARRYDASGTAQGPEFQVNGYTTGNQYLPRVSMASDGGFVVAWESAGEDGSGYGVFARAFDAAGVPQSDEFQLNAYTSNEQRRPVVAAQPGGRFVVSWMSYAQDGSGYGIFGRRFANDRIFGDGFESGDLSRWSATATGGGDLTASAVAAMKFTGVGLQGHINDTAALYVEDDSPDNEDRYRARFYVDTNGFDPGEASGAHRTRTFIVFEEAPTRRLAAIVLKRSAGVYSLEGRARLDDDSQADTGFFDVADGVHVVELDWKRSSSPVAADGTFELWIDGTSQTKLTGLNNNRSSVDFVRLGALNVKAGASGTLFWDEFESRRASYIGP